MSTETGAQEETLHPRLRDDFVTSRTESGPLRVFVTHDSRPADNRECVLFLHGFPDSHETWNPILKQMSRANADTDGGATGGYRVALPHIRGTNRSEKPAHQTDYHIEAILPDLEAVIQFLNPRGGRVHLVGHDWGAFIAWVFVSRPEYARRIASFTALSCPHPAVAKESFKARLSGATPGQFLKAVEQALRSWYVFFFQLPILPELAMQYGGGALWRYMLWAGEIPADDPMRQASTDKIRESALPALSLYRQLLQGKPLPLPERIDVPTQVLIPERDLAITPEIYEDILRYAPGAKLRRLNANHWCHREKPAETWSLIRDFIRQNAIPDN